MKKIRNCPICDFQTTTHIDLKIHIKTCHTRPGIQSPKSKRILKTNTLSRRIVEEIAAPKTQIGQTVIGHTNLLEVQDLFMCEYCDYDTDSSEDLSFMSSMKSLA